VIGILDLGVANCTIGTSTVFDAGVANEIIVCGANTLGDVDSRLTFVFCVGEYEMDDASWNVVPIIVES
jgi:hypothetical protein